MSIADGATLIISSVNWLKTPIDFLDNYSMYDIAQAFLVFVIGVKILGKLIKGKSYRDFELTESITAVDYDTEDTMSASMYREKYGIEEPED